MSQPSMKATVAETPEIGPDEINAELEAILRSNAFERSEKLQKFLRFICELTVRGEGNRINEYLIGAEVFLKGPEYSPNEDSVVRRQAHTLRQKLQQFYAGEGAVHPVRIELPVGRYIPTFRRVKEYATPVENPAREPAIEVPGTVASFHFFSKLTWIIWVTAAIALLMVGYFAGARTSAALPGAATREIWGSWQHLGHTAVICFSSPLTAIIKHFDRELPPDTVPKRFRSGPEDEALFRKTFSIEPGGAFYFTPVINQTKVGEAVAGVHLATMLTRLSIPVDTTQSRFVGWEDVRGKNLILLGNNEANHWLDPLLSDVPFRLTPSEGRRQRAILNTSPRPGEPSEYTINYAANEKEGDREYALISMLPGLGTDQRLLLISGLNAQATQAAAEYLSNEATLAELLLRLQKETPHHAGPWHFQAVVKAEVHDKVPTKTTILAVRGL